MSREEVADFHYFGGNAQSLRILVRTAVRTRKGGMRPTLATIGTIAKYPRPSMMPGNETPVGVSQKKPGYFQNDSAMACRAFRLLGMHETAPGVFSRHPLAYLIEAADDACYAVADIEDAFRLGILTFDEVRDQLAPIAERDRGFTDHMYSSRLSRITRLRSCALAVMVRECGQVFRDSLDELEKGEMTETLMQRTTVSKDHEGLKKLAREKVYQNERVLLIEYAGYSTIGGLLDMFYAALCSPEDASRDEKLRRLLPLDLVWRAYSKRGRTSSSITEFDINLSLMTPYEKLLTVTDYVSGMTDRFAVHLYQRLSGIHLPG
jgi:dGTPase